MQAITYSNYGSPEVLGLNEVQTPVPQTNELLVKIHATTVTPVDCSFRSAMPFYTRLYTGLIHPRHQVLGTEFAGEIVEIGDTVSRFKVGDRIFGGSADGFGAHADYICLPEDGAHVSIPTSMNYAEAASICNGALTALPFLRDNGKIKPGQNVLINGASGSIGIMAVQLAKHFGATVTGVCSTANIELVKSLGADKVLDYTKDDFTRPGDTYDIVFDTVGKSSFSKSKPVLAPHGFYLSTVPTCATVFQFLWTSMRQGKKAVLAATGLRPAADQIEDLEFLKSLLETGKLRTIIDRSYPLEHISEAHHYVEKGHKVGNVVITFAHQPELISAL